MKQVYSSVMKNVNEKQIAIDLVLIIKLLVMVAFGSLKEWFVWAIWTELEP